ncbi:MAG: ImmA/IrrE family metallo-endopeptidase [Nostoc sp.]|uniref:ImmA/IrrE family metallo-endopeptidase n=1 Tax=Nostoc sp. TaxID=1180 RepID=UPI002FFC3E72
MCCSIISLLFDSVTGLPKRKQNNEDEATYLCRCLQIPKSGLLWVTQRKILLLQIAAHFGASEAMVKFRTNVTEVSVKC